MSMPYDDSLKLKAVEEAHEAKVRLDGLFGRLDTMERQLSSAGSSSIVNIVSALKGKRKPATRLVKYPPWEELNGVIEDIVATQDQLATIAKKLEKMGLGKILTP